MSKVLFVKANNRPAEQSATVKLYESFLQTYKETHPNDEITELNLFELNLPYYDLDMLNGLFKVNNGIPTTPEEQKAADLANGYLEQFLNADKVVFAFPLWNFTIPAQLLTYLFYLNQAGKTFKYTEQGPVGLVGGKKVALLQARGGVYSEGPMSALEMSLNYVKNTLAFWGINDPEAVVVEGHNQFQDRAEEIIQDGVKRAAELAARF
ncbi:FMN-dependent NADH-azoreductase [Paenibacillus phoenicis]|uniref:FMN dependent NADH:quinone oxidoreductase n=1 Tax=Paenibacillus phoenicis TaxID=554117 RepID=A0ABU5PHI3_9BACL|nr:MULTISPECIES: FMN-dependent NADH-azoreductase [Paenibacillus]EES75195.1 flavodoxin-like protein [Paenibacillus sp. oral taxon 786 str. D14]MCT2193919.1 FMN-dependent NADH-azoreductase [Paenibacillus sp. p3-SID1389]MEA3569409.1 FMN-dependent NADH-azoreductase [Paenibacillus phoenicis]